MKPSYLFALVAGDLGAVSGSYTTTSGRDVEINVYSEKENVDQCDFAVASLQKVRGSRLGRARQHAMSARVAIEIQSSSLLDQTIRPPMMTVTYSR